MGSAMALSQGSSTVSVEVTPPIAEHRAPSIANALIDRRISFTSPDSVIRVFTFLTSKRRLGHRSRLTTGVRYRRASSRTATTGIHPETVGIMARGIVIRPVTGTSSNQHPQRVLTNLDRVRIRHSTVLVGERQNETQRESRRA